MLSLRFLPATSLTALAVALAAPAFAQETAPAEEPPAPITTAQDGVEPVNGAEGDFSDAEIVVIAGSLRGRIDAPQPAIVELDEEDIASYGAGSLADL